MNRQNAEHRNDHIELLFWDLFIRCLTELQTIRQEVHEIFYSPEKENFQKFRLLTILFGLVGLICGIIIRTLAIIQV